MERRRSWDLALAELRKRSREGRLSSQERTLMKVLDERNSSLYISDFLEDCSDFVLLIQELIK